MTICFTTSVTRSYSPQRAAPPACTARISPPAVARPTRLVLRACLPPCNAPQHVPDSLFAHPLVPDPSLPDHHDDMLFEADHDAPSPPPPPTGGGTNGHGGDEPNDNPGNDADSDPNPEQLSTLLTSLKLSRDQLSAQLSQLPPKTLLQTLQTLLNGPLSRLWPGWRYRTLADISFPFKVRMELTVGLGLAASGMIAARGKRIWKELDLALCDIAVGATLNFMLVYLLAPVAGAAGGAGFLARLPSNAFSDGRYNLFLRSASFLYKGVVFSACGFAGSLVGTTLSQGLLYLRTLTASSPSSPPSSSSASGGGEETRPELPNVLQNSLAWAGFMFVSSNPRYQSVAGLERVLFAVAPERVAKVGSAALRTINNVGGGANWVWWAKFIGLQTSSQPRATEGGEEQSA